MKLPIRRTYCLECMLKIDRLYVMEKQFGAGRARCDECGKTKLAQEFILTRKKKQE